MAGDLEIALRLRYDGQRGASETKRALRGVVDEQKRAERQMRRQTEQRMRQQDRLTRNAQAKDTRAIRASLDAFVRMERQKREEIQRTAREVERSAAAQERTNARLERSARRRRMGMAVAGGVMGAWRASSQANAALGITTRDAATQNYIRTQRDFLPQAYAAGLTDQQIAAFDRNASRVASSSGIAPSSIYSAGAMAQEKYAALPEFQAASQELATFAVATGSRLEEVVDIWGAAQRALGATGEEATEALYHFQKAAEAGSVSFGDFVGSYGRVLGIFASARGSDAGAPETSIELSAIAQQLGRANIAPELGATGVQALLRTMRNPELQGSLRSSGINFVNGQGEFLGVQNMLDQLFAWEQRSGQSLTQSRIGAIAGGEQRAFLALNTLIEQERLNPIADLMSSGSAEAQAMRGELDTRHGRLMNTSTGRVMREQATVESRYFAQADKTIAAQLSLGAATRNLQSSFGPLTVAIEALGTTLMGAGGAAMISGALGGGGRGGLGGAAQALSGAAGKLNSAGAVLGAAAIGFAAGQGLDKLIEETTGQSASSRLTDGMLLLSGQRDAMSTAPRATRGLESGGRQILADPRLVAALQANTRAVRAAVPDYWSSED